MTIIENIPQEISKMNEYLSHIRQESDRGAVLSFAAVIEERLKEVILLFLMDNKSSVKLLDGFNAPLGTFSAKILMAHALGLISEKEFKEIQTLRKIRNRFAHSLEKIDFETNDIKSILYTLPTLGDSEEFRNNPRAFFYHWASILLTRLLWRNKFSIKEKRKESQYDELHRAIENHPQFY